MPALRVSPNPDRGLALSLLLGTDYERKKQKLQQELHLDYQHHVNQKKDLKTSEPQQQPVGLSLPIYERTSVKEKLREERNKEYNLFLQEQAQNRKLKSGILPVISKIHASDGVKISPPASPLFSPDTHTNTNPLHKERPPSRRDAATLTESLNDGESTGIRGPVQRRRRRWQIYRVKEPCSSEEEINTDGEDEFDRRRKDRHTQEPEYREKMRAPECRVNRASQGKKEMEAPVVCNQDSNGTVWKPDLQMSGSKKVAGRPTVNRDKAESATGLLIGATEEPMVTQMKKEQYGQELLRQIAEKQRKKMEKKRLELRAAAIRATDPDKEPDRIQQFGSVNFEYNNLRREAPHKPGKDLEAVGKDPNPSVENGKPTENTEQRAPPGKSQFSTAYSQLPGKTVPTNGMGLQQGDTSLDNFSEDYYRDSSNILGEVTIPRIAGVPPPVPSIVPHTVKTPYDAAYYYYGTRNPLDLHLPHNPISSSDGLATGNQQSGNIAIPSQRTPTLITSDRTEGTHEHTATYLAFEEHLVEKSKQRRESGLKYQEALRQQIKDREERKQREKEENAQNLAKLEAEMRAYNPWGRSGGGAPIKDQKGNLVSDLNEMHKINEASYRNPVSVAGAEGRAPFSHHPTESFKDQPPSQQYSYKEALKQQIEENMRRKREEREHMRIEEEKEEKRLAEQRAHMQQEYEKEQRKQKEKMALKNQGWLNEPPRQEKKKMVRRDEETKKVPQRTRAREEKSSQLNYERPSSPPIPTLQKKLKNLPSRPSSSLSKRSSITSHRDVSAPHQPVPEKVPSQQDGQQVVIRELSALRRHLRKEQKQLEVQLRQVNSQETHYTPVNRRRSRVDDFESSQREAVLSSGRSSSPADAHVNKQNIREFNQFKDRDTASHEEFRATYPYPSTDEQNLDIQQQTLLREQLRKSRLTKRQEAEDFLSHQQDHYYPKKKPVHISHRNPILPSESAFIDVYSGDVYKEQSHQQRSPQPSAEHQERTAPRRRHSCDEVAESMGDNQAGTSVKLHSKVWDHDQHHIMRQDSHSGDHNKSEGWPGDELDVSSLRSALGRRVSVDTVATEPWLRPGTSDAVKHSHCRERPNSRTDAPPWLT